MTTDTITLMLEGDVPLESFAEAMKAFSGLVLALSREEGGGIEWTIEDLAPGSALATIRGRSNKPERVERVVRSYVQIGRTLQRGESIQRPHSISRPALRLGKIIGERVKSIRFETPEEEAIVSTRPSSRSLSNLLTTNSEEAFEVTAGTSSIVGYGAIEGEVETLSKRHGLRFTLYDSLNDRAVSCYLQPGQEEKMRDVWGKRAIVEGWVSRDATDGHPIAIREVVNVIPIYEEGDYIQGRGILPLKPNSDFPEDRIRRLRDG